MTAPRVHRAGRTPYQTPMARSMLRDLGTAARAGKLTSHEAGFVASLERQAALGRWHPSQRQVAAIRRLHQNTLGGVMHYSQLKWRAEKANAPA